MKGIIERVLMIIVVLVPALILVSYHGTNLVTLVDGGRQLDARFGAMEIASAISVLQAGPDGVEHRYPLPSVDLRGCVKIFPTYVETNLGGVFKGRQADAQLVERATFSAAVNFGNARQGEPIVIDCKAGSVLALRKESGKVSVTAANASVQA